MVGSSKKLKELHETLPQPEKKMTVKKDGLDHRPAPIRVPRAPAGVAAASTQSMLRARSSIRSAQVLLAAASKPGVGIQDAATHVRSIATLCEACSLGKTPAQPASHGPP